MHWPKQVRRGLTTGLAVTSAAWVHAAHAEALPEISDAQTNQPHDITSYARSYEAAVLQAEARAEGGQGAVSTVRPRVVQSTVEFKQPAQATVQNGSTVTARAPVMRAPAQAAAAPDSALIASANSASVKSMTGAKSSLSAMAYAPVAQAQPQASMQRPRITATVTRTPFMPVAAQSSNPAYAAMQANPVNQEAASIAADQQRNFRTGTYLPATEAAATYAQLQGYQPSSAASLSELRTAAGPIASATKVQKPEAGMNAFSARAQDSALLTQSQGYLSATAQTHHQIAIGVQQSPSAPETVALNKAQLAKAPAMVSSGMQVSSMLPQNYMHAELAPPPALLSAQEEAMRQASMAPAARMQPVAAPARAMRAVVASPAMAAKTPAMKAPAMQPMAEAAPQPSSAYASAYARKQEQEYAALQPAAGGLRMSGGAFAPMLTAASVAQAQELLTLPGANPEAAPSLPPIAPLAPQAATQAMENTEPLAAMPSGPVPAAAPMPMDAAAMPPLPPDAVAAAGANVPATAAQPSASPAKEAVVAETTPPSVPPLPPEAVRDAGAGIPNAAAGGAPAPTPMAAGEMPPLPPVGTPQAAAAPVAAVPPTPVEPVPNAADAPAQTTDVPPGFVTAGQAPAKPPIIVPVSPADKSVSVPVTAKAPKVSPEKVLADQQKKLAAETRAEKMQANKMPIQLERSRPLDSRLNGEGESESKIQRVDGVGLSIAVRTPKIDAAYELSQAYEALMGGDSAQAASIYRRILDAQPRNVDALFGLATTYHRTGALDKAKPIYATLLAVAPDHRDGLNNFLMLLGEQNPQEALMRLQALEAANHSYAPIPAQIAMIQERLGNMAEAVDAMTRAVSRAPENVQYRYNLAVLLDKAGNWQDAASIYQDVLAAVDRGEKVPAARDDIQRRLTYIMTNHG